jgi:hypothetical protein
MTTPGYGDVVRIIVRVGCEIPPALGRQIGKVLEGFGFDVSEDDLSPIVQTPLTEVKALSVPYCYARRGSSWDSVKQAVYELAPDTPLTVDVEGWLKQQQEP